MKQAIKDCLHDYAVVLLAPLILLGPLMLRGQVLFWGTPSLQFVPWWVQVWAGLRQGSLPLWNPLNGMGAPLLANYQLAFFYPPNWGLLIAAALGGAAGVASGVAWGYTLLAMLHLAWAGLGMALLLRRLSFPWLAQVLGGLAFGLSGYIVGRLGFFSMVWVAAWLPWVIYFADAIASPASDYTVAAAGDSLKKTLLFPGLVLCLAMQLLAGHAQLTWYTLLLAGAWVTVGALRQAGWRGLLPAWLRLGVSGLLAATIAALQLAPTFEYLRQSSRADAYAFQDALTFSFWPWRLLTLASPDFFGSPSTGDFWGYASFWEDHLYLGVMPLLLALASLVLLLRGLRRTRQDTGRRAISLFLWGLLAVTLVLALGKYTPVFPFLYLHVPTFAMFQAPARYLIWAAFAIPLLAGVGVERWRSPTGRGLYWFRLGTAGAFAVTLGAGLAWMLMKDIRLTFVRATALTGWWALGFGLLTLLIPWVQKRGLSRWWRWAVIAWALADLLVTGWSLNPGVDLAFYEGRLPAATAEAAAEAPAMPLSATPPVTSGQRIYLSRAEEYDLKFKRFLRFKSYLPVEDWRALRAALIPNLNLLDGVATVNNFDPLVPGRYALWMERIDQLGPREQLPWLALMNVGAVEHIDISQPGGVRFDPLQGARRWRWYPCVTAATSEAQTWQVLDGRMQSGADPLREPLIVEGLTGDVGVCDQSLGAEDADITLTSEHAGALVLQVNAPSAGWLMVADVYYPGWQATVDGTRTPIYPANAVFRGIYLPAGQHQVSINYRPVGFYFGALFSILGMFGMTWLLKQRGMHSQIRLFRL